MVVTARNDDHGGNLARRMQAFVDGLLAQCRRHRVPAELVMVEWNPPPDRPPLAEALDWSAQNEFCAVRIIEVPAALHGRFRYGQALPLYQMIAKNVGIRRARGEFILATNIDILFSDELFKILAARALETGKMYRADRWDVMADIPADQPIEQQLAWCNSHLLRVNRREGTFPLNPDGSMKIDAERYRRLAGRDHAWRELVSEGAVRQRAVSMGRKRCRAGHRAGGRSAFVAGHRAGPGRG